MFVHSKMNQPSRTTLQCGNIVHSTSSSPHPQIILKVVIVFSRQENQAYVGW